MKASMYFAAPLSILTCIAPGVFAHGNHGQSQQQSVGEVSGDWATRHLVEEHHINNFDPTTFFKLHDFDSAGRWSPTDIRRLYGLYDESNDHVPETKKADIVKTVLDLYDYDQSGTISLDEFLRGTNMIGTTLPDFGTGPGHHGDDEYEYEIHHFEKYHSGDDVTEDDLTHPEDIEHFKKHEEREAEVEAWEAKERHGIVLENIPSKFRRN